MKPVFSSIGELYHKLERDGHRAIHARTKRHMADHFFNFCVTAHSLRDFFFEAKALPLKSPDRNAYHDVWNADSQLVAVREIANLTKHFELRDLKTGQLRPSRTRNVIQRRGTAFDVVIAADHSILTIPRPAREILIRTSDGAQYDLWEFVVDVANTWRAFLNASGIRVRRQSLAQLLDEPGGA
jgi:hypothetical protein